MAMVHVTNCECLLLVLTVSGGICSFGMHGEKEITIFISS